MIIMKNNFKGEVKMKNKIFQNANKVFCVWGMIVITLVVLMTSAQTVSASTASTNKKAVDAYRKILAKKTYSWDRYAPGANKTSNYLFACVDLNGDGIKELIIENPNACYAAGYVKIFTYVNNRVKCVTTCSGFQWYKKAKIIGIEDAHTGAYWGDYYKLGKNGELISKASYSGTDLKYYAKHVKHTGTVNGYRVYYTSYRINGKETSYSNYKKQFKKITKNQKAITVQLKKNTKANRAKL